MSSQEITDHSALPRVGVIVPPANPTVEPEMARLLDHRLVSVHTGRFPVFTGWDQQQRNRGYLDALPDAVAGFGALQLDAIFIACTGSHYLLTPEADAELCARLSDQRGAPVRSATLTITDLLRAAGQEQIYVASPYEDWLTALSEQYWERAGFTVTGVVRVRAKDSYSPYDVTPEELARQVEAAHLPDDAAVLFTGTGMPTLGALQHLTSGNERFGISSNVCGAYWLASTIGGGSASMTDGASASITGGGSASMTDGASASVIGGESAFGHPLLTRLRSQVAHDEAGDR